MKRGQTLVASLIVIVIILIAAAVIYGGFAGAKPTPKADGRGKTVLGNARASAQDEVCRSNIAQVRALLETAKAGDDEFKPKTVAEIPGAAAVSTCPVGHEPYTIDEEGKVHCPHLGHEKF